MSSERTCPVRVHPPGASWGGRACGRDLTTDKQREAEMCGPHLAGRRRRAANDAARDERCAAERAESEALQSLAGRLQAFLPDAEHGDLWAFESEIRIRRPAAERLLALLEADDLAEGA